MASPEDDTPKINRSLSEEATPKLSDANVPAASPNSYALPSPTIEKSARTHSSASSAPGTSKFRICWTDDHEHPHIHSKPMCFLIIPIEDREHISLLHLRGMIEDEFDDDELSIQFPFLVSGRYSFLLDDVRVSRKQEPAVSLAEVGNTVTVRL
jgi:hypothetical protein